MNDKLVKVMQIGSNNVGKSSLIVRYMENKFDSLYIPTIGLEFNMVKFKYPNDTVLSVQLWDLSLKNRFNMVFSNYLKKADALIATYDVTDKSSIEYLVNELEALDSYMTGPVNIWIVGNKSDLGEQRQDMSTEINQLREKKWNALVICKEYEVSAKTGDNVKTLFEDIFEKISKSILNNLSQIILKPKNQIELSSKCF